MDVPFVFRVMYNLCIKLKKCTRKNQNCKHIFFKVVSQKNCLATSSLLLLLLKLLLLLWRSRITKGGCVGDKLLKPALKIVTFSSNSVTSHNDNNTTIGNIISVLSLFLICFFNFNLKLLLDQDGHRILQPIFKSYSFNWKHYTSCKNTVWTDLISTLNYILVFVIINVITQSKFRLHH